MKTRKEELEAELKEINSRLNEARSTLGAIDAERIDKERQICKEIYGVAEGVRIRYRGKEYIVSDFRPWMNQKPSVYGLPMKTDGTPSKQRRYIGYDYEVLDPR